jgi:membrane protein implicated in regulation of membrane protease activity
MMVHHVAARAKHPSGRGGDEDRLSADQMVGRVGRVTGTIAPGRIGEVMVAIRGGSEAFHAYSADSEDTIETGRRVVVVEYFPPRTVVVSPV